MIDNDVIELTEDLVSVWNTKSREFARYRLDFSWPSLGTIDLLLSQYVGRQTLSKQAENLLLQCCAYIGGIAYDYWLTFPDKPRVELRLDTSGPVADIVLTASNGAHLGPGQYYEIRIRSALQNLLSKPSRQMPIFADGIRRYIPEDRLVCSFAAAVCSGMSPYGEGPWKDLSLQDFAPQLSSVSKKMAASSADYYATSFPLVKELGSEVLYYPHLCLPPAGFDEPFLGVRGASGIIDFVKHRNLSAEEAKQIALALASSCDELASLAGIIASVALHGSASSPELLKVCHQRSLTMPALRKSVEIIRQMYSGEGFWIERLLLGQTEYAYAMFSLEHSIGMLPLAFGTSSALFEQLSTRDLYQFICLNDLNKSIQLCELHVESFPSNTGIQLQLAYLYLTRGELQSAEKWISTLLTRSNLLKSELALLQELRALFAERHGRIDEAEDFYLSAAEKTNEPYTKARLYLWLAKRRRAEHDIEHWGEYAKLALQFAPDSPDAALLNYFYKKQSNDFEQSSDNLKSLLRSHPNDKRVFFEFLSA